MRRWVVGALLLAPLMVQASTTGMAGFETVHLWIVDNLNGSLGRMVVISLITVGLLVGIVKQSLVAFVAAILGLVKYQVIIDDLMTVTVVSVMPPSTLEGLALLTPF